MCSIAISYMLLKNIDCHKININRINQQTDSFLDYATKQEMWLHFNGRLVYADSSISSFLFNQFNLRKCECAAWVRCTASKMVFRIFNVCKMQKKHTQKFDFLIWPNQCIWTVTKMREKSKREREENQSRQRNVHKKCIELFALCKCVDESVCTCSMQYAICIPPLSGYSNDGADDNFGVEWFEMNSCHVSSFVAWSVLLIDESHSNQLSKRWLDTNRIHFVPPQSDISIQPHRETKKRVAVVVIVVVGSSTIQPSNHHTSHLVQMKLTPNPKNRNKWKLWNERKKNDDDEKKNEKDYIERIKNTIPMRYHMAPRWLRTEWILPKGKPQHCTVYIHIRFFCSHFQSPVSIHHNHFSLAILSLLLHVSRV